MQAVLDALANRGLEKETASLENFYRDVRISVENYNNAEGKQKIVADLYERFFKGALPDETFKSLGIAYTPVEVVDYIVRSVEDLLNSEFDASLSDDGVHIIDPFVGTGTFITRLLQSGIINGRRLAAQIRRARYTPTRSTCWHITSPPSISKRCITNGRQADEYQPFEGIVLTDTFQAYESSAPADEHLVPGEQSTHRAAEAALTFAWSSAIRLGPRAITAPISP